MFTTKKALTLGICVVALGLGACADDTPRDTNPVSLPDRDPATAPAPAEPNPAPADDPALPAN